ncbi:hypothetical protein IDJ75_11600 [Mucilaginibacter rigui]|uniref:Uncharacterized protein n=1 Tax=Mucilaginibacter rigui TaxID=534635 RepID=A0ABR7X5S2_9SPHI|nr:hypothetical protein [Mucilaginibacter rigui]MBD1385927.1 hypothetical protein [Mucilaginibacter rigui]
MTKRLIELQAKGYDHDYLLEGANLVCVQDSHSLPLTSAWVKLIDQAYDRLSKTFKYIHSIDTGNGEKGVIIADAIIINGVIA